MVAVGAYTHEINAHANQLLVVLAVTLGLAILIGAAVAFLYANHWSRLIRRIVSQAQSVAQGDLSISALELNSKDELGELTHHVNSGTGGPQGHSGAISGVDAFVLMVRGLTLFPLLSFMDLEPVVQKIAFNYLVALLMSRFDTVTIAAHQAAMNFVTLLYVSYEHLDGLDDRGGL